MHNLAKRQSSHVLNRKECKDSILPNVYDTKGNCWRRSGNMRMDVALSYWEKFHGKKTYLAWVLMMAVVEKLWRKGNHIKTVLYYGRNQCGVLGQLQLILEDIMTSQRKKVLSKLYSIPRMCQMFYHHRYINENMSLKRKF